MKFTSETLFEYQYDGWVYRGTKTKGVFRLQKRGIRASKFHTCFTTNDFDLMEKYRNREIHPARVA